VGTPFHGSHLPLHKWFLAIHLLHVKEPRGSVRDVQRWLGVTYKTAWNVAQRLKVPGRHTSRNPDEIIRRLCGLSP